MDIGVVIHPKKPSALAFAPDFIRILEELGARVMLEEGMAARLHKNSLAVQDVFRSDCVAALGGDGLLLSCAQKAALCDVPLIGVNLGRLGFLTELQAEEKTVREGFSALLRGEYTLDGRMMLSARAPGITGEEIVLNDIVVARASLAQVVRLEVYVNEELAGEYVGDGVIVSSPTGSTAYSLSAGGPVVSPSMECMVVSPICPHLLHARPWVVPGDARVAIRLPEGESNSMATLDGQRAISLQSGDLLEISRAEVSAHFIRIEEFRFFDLLRRKLSHW